MEMEANARLGRMKDECARVYIPTPTTYPGKQCICFFSHNKSDLEKFLNHFLLFLRAMFYHRAKVVDFFSLIVPRREENIA